LLDGGKNEWKACTCTAPQIRRYLSRISGPLLDRIDIHIEVPRLSSQELMGKSTGESSACVRQRVVAARKKQVDRMSGSGISCNAQMKAKGLRDYCDMDAGPRTCSKQLSRSSRLVDVATIARRLVDLTVDKALRDVCKITEATQRSMAEAKA
jgi:magnesium chelatase family protein